MYVCMYVCMYYIGTSDFITLHTPLTAETKNLLNDATLAKCKRGLLHSYVEVSACACVYVCM